MKKEGEAFAREHGLVFMETSAKTAANVEEVSSYLIFDANAGLLVGLLNKEISDDINPWKGILCRP